MKAITCLIFSLLVSSTFLYSQTQDDLIKKSKKERLYKLHKIDSTERYFIVNTTVANDSVILVIDKNSKQLENKEFKECKSFKFITYRFYDVASPSGIWCHEVDHREVWCERDKKALHFTDGMGNEYFEEE